MKGYERGLTMIQIILSGDPGGRFERCQRPLALLLQRNLPHLHRQHARDEERCAEPLSIDLSVDLTSRFVNTEIRKQARKPLIADTGVLHFSLDQLLGFLLPSLVWLSTLIWQSIHRPSSPLTLSSLIASWRLFKAILGRIRPIADCKKYTYTEQTFCGDSLLRGQSIDRVDYQLPGAGGLR